MLTLYVIHHRPGKNIANADALSRCPAHSADPVIPYLPEVLLLDEQLNGPVTATEVAKFTTSDPTLKIVQKYIISGWPDSKVSDVLRPYKSCKDSLSTQQTRCISNTVSIS